MQKILNFRDDSPRGWITRLGSIVVQCVVASIQPCAKKPVLICVHDSLHDLVFFAWVFLVFKRPEPSDLSSIMGKVRTQAGL